MIYSWPPCPPARVTDANGLEWSHCLFLNTETGMLCRYVTDADRLIVTDLRGVPIQEKLTIPRPIKVEMLR